MNELVPIHIGLMGHIDHGKTALAKVLSEKVSTAGLDAHPQAKKRGITIDLGFTMFILGNKLVTLVDSPGHADLIRSVVAGAGIIDAAILVVAADEGPMIQTGEHLIVLEAMGIKHLIVAISKIELVSETEIKSVLARMKSLIAGANFEKVAYVKVSAFIEAGLDELRKCIAEVEPMVRRPDRPLFVPIDHAFNVKGHGTVVTGTLLEGTISVGQRIKIEPPAVSARVRSIQTFGESRESASSGDRVGLNLPEVDPDKIFRGCYISEDPSLKVTLNVHAHMTMNPLYKGRVTKKMIVSATIGMPTVTAEVVPVDIIDDKWITNEEVDSNEFDCILSLQRRLAIRPNMKIILIRTDFAPTMMRIVATGFVIQPLERMLLHKRRQRIGRIQRIRDDDVLVEGLASTQEIAKKIVGKKIMTESKIDGIVIATFGTRGVIIAKFDGPVKEKDPVIFERLVEEVYKVGF